MDVAGDDDSVGVGDVNMEVLVGVPTLGFMGDELELNGAHLGLYFDGEVIIAGGGRWVFQ